MTLKSLVLALLGWCCIVSSYAQSSDWKVFGFSNSPIFSVLDIEENPISGRVYFTNAGNSIHYCEGDEIYLEEGIQSILYNVISFDGNKCYLDGNPAELFHLWEGDSLREFKTYFEFGVTDPLGNITIDVDAEHRLLMLCGWYFAQGAGLYVYEEDTLRHVEMLDSMHGVPYKVIAADNGDIWCAWSHDGGVAKYDGTNWTTYRTSDGEFPLMGVSFTSWENDVLGLEGDKLWVATREGLATIENGVVELFTTANSGLPCDFLRSVMVDGLGRKWIGTDCGQLVMYDDSTWVVWDSTNSPIPADIPINHMEISEENEIWISLNNYGVARFDGYKTVPYHYHCDNCPSIVNVYPNPTTDQIRVQFAFLPASSTHTVSVCDMRGRTMLKGEAEGPWFDISLGNFSKGIYLLQITNPDGQYVHTERIVVQ
jgi:hypothetical protein